MRNAHCEACVLYADASCCAAMEELKDRRRFEASVNRAGPVPAHCPELGPCHVWTAYRDPNGYGRFHMQGKMRWAHRVAFFFAHGRWPIPEGCHRCDNRPCVNEAHLFEGTRQENVDDMMSKRRVARGPALPQTRLSDREVSDIRANYALCRVTQLELGERYGVHQVSISRIVNGRSRINA